jgi:hypothetical protein
MRRLSSVAQEHAGPDHILSLLRRLRLDWLLHHFPQRLVRSLYVFVNGFITIGVLALLELVSRNPFVCPSLGPTAHLLFGQTRPAVTQVTSLRRRAGQCVEVVKLKTEV